jgi:hypothetical protein
MRSHVTFTIFDPRRNFPKLLFAGHGTPRRAPKEAEHTHTHTRTQDAKKDARASLRVGMEERSGI